MANTLRAPGNAPFYGAPGLWARHGKDGALYVVATGQAPGYSDIGPIAFRILPSGASEWLTLEQRPPVGIAGFVVETDTGAEVAWFGKDGRSWVTVPLPGYQRRGLPDSAGQAPVVVPAPSPSQPAPGGPPAGWVDDDVDDDGRKYTNETKKLLLGEVGKLDARIDALEARPAGGAAPANGVNRDEAWAMAPHSVFVDIQRPESGIREVMENIARAAASSAPGIGRDQVKALVREALLELINE